MSAAFEGPHGDQPHSIVAVFRQGDHHRRTIVGWADRGVGAYPGLGSATAGAGGVAGGQGDYTVVGEVYSGQGKLVIRIAGRTYPHQGKPLDTRPAMPFAIGGGVPGTGFAEALIFDRALEEREMHTLEQYLGPKYGVPVRGGE
jgi:hypothetical protein